MNLYTPLLCVSNSTACAAKPPFFFPLPLRNKLVQSPWWGEHSGGAYALCTKALFAHRAHSVFVRRTLQAEATPACCSALLRVRANLLSGFESQTCVGIDCVFHFHFERDHVNDGFLFPPSLPSVHCSVHETYCCPWSSPDEACIFSASEPLPCYVC